MKSICEVNFLQTNGIQSPLLDMAELELSLLRQINETGRPDYTLQLASGHLWNVHLTNALMSGELDKMTQQQANAGFLSPMSSGPSASGHLRLVNGLPFAIEGMFSGEDGPHALEVCEQNGWWHEYDHGALIGWRQIQDSRS